MDNTSVSPGVGQTIFSQFFHQQVSPSQGASIEALMNAAINSSLPTLTKGINDKLATLDATGFLKAMGNSAAGSSKTLPVDYASDPTMFTLSIGAGATSNNLSISDIKNFKPSAADGNLPDKGVGASFSGLLGLNLRAFNPPRWEYFDFSRLTLFGSFFAASRSDIGNNHLEVDYKTFGLHGQYQLLDSKALLSGGLLRWGGLAVATGFSYSSLKVLLDGDVPGNSLQTQTQNLPIANQPLPLTIAYSGNAKLGADISVLSIPIEVMTHAQLLYLLSLYVGGGFDAELRVSPLGSVVARYGSSSTR